MHVTRTGTAYSSRDKTSYLAGSWRYPLTLIALLLMILIHLQIGSSLSITQQWQALFDTTNLEFAFLQFHDAALPRVVMAILVGAALGLSGSLLQQLTQNRLVSPMTIGSASGAWLGLVCATLIAPELAAEHGEWPALLGAMAAVCIVLVIAGRAGIAGLPIVLAGMAMNLLLGALASGLVMLNDQYARNLFLWGAGDLAQMDWHWVIWLLPKLAVGVLILAFAQRPLTLLRLGGEGAQARGMSLWPVMLALFLASLWLTSVSITAVGLIGFIGLLTPNLAKLFGARTAFDELLYSTVLGALLLLATDALAVLASQWTVNLVPSGAAAALIGAPALLWLSRRRLSAEDQRGLTLPGKIDRRITPLGWLLIAGATLLIILLTLSFAPSAHGWTLQWPSSLVWSLRWPRTLTAASAGFGLAIAGVILQRLLRNPLASPDILGLSAGATLALLMSAFVMGGTIQTAGGPLAAFAGSMLVLAVLLLFGRRHQYAPGMLALVGISLMALLDAVLQFALAKGTADSFAIMGWLAGSTYRVSSSQAIWLCAGVLIIGSTSLLFHRGLSLISIGDGVALGRGLSLTRLRIVLLVLVSLLCALVTSVMGPVAFLGLLAPHIAAILGARKVLPQLLLAATLGSVVMLVADWIGRVMIYPLQMPVGIMASVLCGIYFICLLAKQRCE
jgi:iron complex transport system permease protein